MNAFTLKLLAITTMLIDHIGMIFFPDTLWFRMVGRLSFPLFAWLIANGAKYTKNINAYMLRLFIFAFLAQIPFLLASQIATPEFFGLNIMFTLLLGLAAIKIWEGKKGGFLKIAMIALAAITASVIKADYGAMGVLSIFFFYLFSDDIKKMAESQTLIFSVGWMLQLFFAGEKTYALNILQVVAALSVVFIAQYDKKQGPRLKYFFYFFYPVHLLILYGIKVFVL